MQSDAQAEAPRSGALDIILRTVAMLGFASSAAIIGLVALGDLGTLGLYMGFVSLMGGPAGFGYLARRGPVRILPLLVPFISMMVGAVGMLVSGWTLMLLIRQ